MRTYAPTRRLSPMTDDMKSISQITDIFQFIIINPFTFRMFPYHHRWCVVVPAVSSSTPPPTNIRVLSRHPPPFSPPAVPSHPTRIRSTAAQRTRRMSQPIGWLALGRAGGRAVGLMMRLVWPGLCVFVVWRLAEQARACRALCACVCVL